MPFYSVRARINRIVALSNTVQDILVKRQVPPPEENGLCDG